MAGARPTSRWGRVRAELESAFEERHPPGEVAASFSFGLFVTTLPTMGTGLLLFVALAALSDRVSKVALFASVLILNPLAKGGVYVASYWVGSQLLGPIPGGTVGGLSMAAGSDVALRLLVGNVVLAAVLALVGYVAAVRFVDEYRRRTVDLDRVLPGAP